MLTDSLVEQSYSARSQQFCFHDCVNDGAVEPPCACLCIDSSIPAFGISARYRLVWGEWAQPCLAGLEWLCSATPAVITAVTALAAVHILAACSRQGAGSGAGGVCKHTMLSGRLWSLVPLAERGNCST